MTLGRSGAIGRSLKLESPPIWRVTQEIEVVSRYLQLIRLPLSQIAE